MAGPAHPDLIPTGMPVLGRGAHRDPAAGACLMELVSWLAGEPFSDDPACTHPVLAAIARTVNDLLDDEERQVLARLAPELIGTAAAGPRADAMLVRLCCRAARVDAPWLGRFRLGWLDRAAGRRLARADRQAKAGGEQYGPLVARGDLSDQQTAWATWAATSAARSLRRRPDASRRLVELLARCVAATRRQAGIPSALPASTLQQRSLRQWPARQPSIERAPARH